MKTPEIGGEVHARPADAPPVNQRSLRLGLLLRRLAERGRLQLRMIGEFVLSQDFDFVVGEIGFRQVRALLQHHHAKAAGRKLLGEDAAGCA